MGVQIPAAARTLSRVCSALRRPATSGWTYDEMAVGRLPHVAFDHVAAGANGRLKSGDGVFATQCGQAPVSDDHRAGRRRRLQRSGTATPTAPEDRILDELHERGLWRADTLRRARSSVGTSCVSPLGNQTVRPLQDEWATTRGWLSAVWGTIRKRRSHSNGIEEFSVAQVELALKPGRQCMNIALPANGLVSHRARALEIVDMTIAEGLDRACRSWFDGRQYRGFPRYLRPARDSR